MLSKTCETCKHYAANQDTDAYPADCLAPKARLSNKFGEVSGISRSKDFFCKDWERAIDKLIKETINQTYDKWYEFNADLRKHGIHEHVDPYMAFYKRNMLDSQFVNMLLKAFLALRSELQEDPKTPLGTYVVKIPTINDTTKEDKRTKYRLWVM